MSTYTNDSDHFTFFYGSISINIVHWECPIQFVSNFSRRRYIDSKEKLFEIDRTTVVSVECSEHMLTEFLRISTREKLGIDF